MKEKLLSKKSLLALGFKKAESKGLKGVARFVHNHVQVVLKKGEKENPEISMIVSNTRVFFPGAYTLKDLKDLLFFHYGEEGYRRMFPQKAEIISVEKPKK